MPVRPPPELVVFIHKLRFYNTGTDVLNVYYYVSSSNLNSQVEVDDAAVDLLTYWEATVLAFAGPHLGSAGAIVRVYAASVNFEGQYVQDPTAFPGTFGGAADDDRLCGLVSIRSAAIGRHSRGRKFYAGVTADHHVEGLLTTPAFSALNDLALTFLVPVTTGGKTLDPCLYDRVAGTYTLALGTNANSLLSTNRLRTPGRGS